MKLRILLILFSFLFLPYAQANEHFVSLTAKAKEDSMICHIIWATKVDNSYSYKIHESTYTLSSNSEIAEAMFSWITAQANPQEKIYILYDPKNLPKELLDSWNTIQKDHLNIATLNIRPVVVASIDDPSLDVQLKWGRVKASLKRSMESRMRYLVHSSPQWQRYHNLNVNNEETVRSLNYEQLRAYLWAKKILKTRQGEAKAIYWISKYYGIPCEIYEPGHWIWNDNILICANGSGYAGTGDGIITDIQEIGNNHFCIFSVCLEEYLKTVGLDGGGHGIPWEHHHIQSLKMAPNEFLDDIH